MRNLKKFLALVLAFMMAMSLMVTVNAAKSPVAFDDVDKVTSTYAEAVNVLSALGIVKGQGADEAGQFKPKDPITRAETAMMLYRIAHNDAAGVQVGIYKDYDFFPDVKSDKWYAGAVNYCANSELIKGWGGAFHPSDNVTGYEVLAMVLRMIGYGKNNEFSGAGWQIQTASYGRLAGLTKNIKEGTLGQDATREVVAEIMFQALQADLVDYNMLRNYYPRTVLLEANDDNRTNYANAINAGILTLPLNADLMYVNYGIVGKSPTLTFDKYGRPYEMWVKDGDSTIEDTSTAGEYSKYIPNLVDGANDVGTAVETADEQVITVKLTAKAIYDNAVTECQVAKDVTGDKSVAWANILEVLNGNSEANFDGSTGTLVGITHTLNVTAHSGDMDALHTSDKWIGATGRTTEIYDVQGYNVTDGTNAQKYIIVYVDTYLAEVKSITEAVKDPNNHVIKAAAAIVKMGTDEIEVSLESAGSYKVGDLVLVQTANGGAATAVDDITAVTTGERVPETPADVHIVNATGFPAAGTNCRLEGKADTRRVTINATVGTRDGKMGIITNSGDTIMASNTFLANKTAGAAKSVLPEWWDMDDDAKGITNSMIGRTFDVVLDQHGYIVGMKEVLTTESNVGIITGYDQYRVGTGKYLTRVEAYMSDGTTQTFDVVDMTASEAAKIAKDRDTNAFDTSKFAFFKTGGAADTAWDVTSGIYAKDAKLGIGALVMFKQCTVDGVSAWYFEDASDITTAAATLKDKAGNAVADNLMVGTALSTGASFNTGDALAIGTVLELDATAPTPTMIDHQLDNKSIIFVAEAEYAYNTGSENEGDNTLKYNVYEGFKKAPTIAQASADQNILFQQLVNHPEYVLVYPQQTNKEYIIKNQGTIIVDDSYLVLSRGATYAGYSEYNVLKNGKADVLKVSNSNTTLNQAIETAMAAGDLITVTGRNSAGYVIAADTVTGLATNSNDVAIANCGGVNDGGNPNPLVSGDAGTKFSENDGVLNFIDGNSTDQGLTLADGCTIQLVNLGTGAVKDISIGVAKVYINNEGSALQAECDFTFELDQYGYVCSLYVIEK